MLGRPAVQIELDKETEQALEQLVRRRSAGQQIVLRARIILLAAQGKTSTQIANDLAITREMVGLWRGRWASFAAIPLAELSVSERLEDAPRSGKPPTITPEQVCQITALACEAPERSGRPLSHWSGQEIADEITRRGIVETISPRHAQRLLKRGICNPTASATG
jgi:putative transposase